ncbi:DUF2613 family protein [Corynebacterium mendelii]|uniref:DUF2613 family protein n=1 Tax=Corynebacterium mendelii TaxID=2765362 RepID=A0A939E2F3_9CORY|nr:DUF2613 family protein [Corynebacterium mendelii]MBN9645225.1 DUF2613 family protein [Corynebacterium mendelii]
MAFESDSLNRRTVGPALAASVIGMVVGIAAIAGVAALGGGDDPAPQHTTGTVVDPLLGGPEYGSRQSVAGAEIANGHPASAPAADR